MGSERHPPQRKASAGACAFVPQDVAFSWADCSKQEKQVVHEKGNKACRMCSVFEVEKCPPFTIVALKVSLHILESVPGSACISI